MLPEKTKQFVQYFIELGCTLDFDTSRLEAYLTGLKTTGEDIFNYYIGEALYFLGREEEAFEYLIKYQGVEKRIQAYHYLLELKKKNPKIKIPIQTIGDIQMLYMFQNQIKIPNPLKRKVENKDKENKKYTKGIHMTVDDFIHPNKSE